MISFQFANIANDWRRYYSNAILGCLHRTIAIPEWSRLRNGEDVPLERALGAFDMFVLGAGTGDLENVRIQGYGFYPFKY